MSRGKDCDGGLRCIARNLGNILVAGYEKTLKEEMPLFNEVGSLLSLWYFAWNIQGVYIIPKIIFMTIMHYHEKYTLHWHSYSDHLREALNEMLLSSEFADVTLVTDDKQQIRAHRNILSACSPAFKNILQLDCNNTNPVIYLRGIQHSEMKSIIQFIYLGEARFYEERMSEFLRVSKNLEIKDLSCQLV